MKMEGTLFVTKNNILKNMHIFHLIDLTGSRKE